MLSNSLLSARCHEAAFCMGRGGSLIPVVKHWSIGRMCVRLGRWEITAKGRLQSSQSWEEFKYQSAHFWSIRVYVSSPGDTSFLTFVQSLTAERVHRAQMLQSCYTFLIMCLLLQCTSKLQFHCVCIYACSFLLLSGKFLGISLI